MESQVFFGSEIKLNISIEPIGDLTMDDYDFECEFYCFSNRRVTLGKDSLIRQDGGNYLAVLDSKSLSTGILKCKITAYIPDADCNNGLRTEVLKLDTKIQIMGV